MAENEETGRKQSPENESQSEDDIDKLFKEEIKRLGQQETPGPSDPLPPGTQGHSTEVETTTNDLEVDGITCQLNGDHSGKLILSTSGSSSLLGSFWNWSTSTYRWTRQLFVEGLGYGLQTTDPQLRSDVIALYHMRRQYRNICNIVTKLVTNFERVLETQQELGNAFRLMSIQDENLTKEYQYNTELQSVLYRNGNTLLVAMRSFISGIQTLCNQTIIDTLWTAKQLNYARIQHDALKSELDAFRSKNSDGQRLRDLERNFEKHKEKYENLKENLQVKLKLLHEHRVGVMHHQLESFQNAIKDYFTENGVSELDNGITHSFQQLSTTSDRTSWLEQKD